MEIERFQIKELYPVKPALLNAIERSFDREMDNASKARVEDITALVKALPFITHLSFHQGYFKFAEPLPQSFSDDIENPENFPTYESPQTVQPYYYAIFHDEQGERLGIVSQLGETPEDVIYSIAAGKINSLGYKRPDPEFSTLIDLPVILDYLSTVNPDFLEDQSRTIVE